jgi:acyl-CoA thioesterase
VDRPDVARCPMPSCSEMLAGDPFATLLGIELVSEDPITVALTVGPNHLNFLDVTHGAVVFSLADCAFSLASNAAGVRAVAIDTHLVLTSASGPGNRLTAVAEETTRGRSLGTYRIIVTRGDGRITGLFTGTVSIAAS